jgi:hypothetical protein
MRSTAARPCTGVPAVARATLRWSQFHGAILHRMPSSSSRAFCRAVFEDTGGRVLRWATIDSVADRLDIDHDKAEAIAAELEERDLVRIGSGHCVTLRRGGNW